MPFVRPSTSPSHPVRNSEPVAPCDPIERQLQLFETAIISIQKTLTALAENLAESGNPVPQQTAARSYERLKATLTRITGKKF